MELIKLVGVLIVIVGFALKLDSILIIFLALITTGLVGGLGIDGLLEAIGTNFVANRSMAIFIMILLITGAFNVGFGGVAGFVRPVVLPMAEAAVKNQGHEASEEHVEDIKGMASAMENITWFFFQVLFVGGSGGILVQSTLASLGYEVELIELAAAEIPVAIVALIVGCSVTLLNDKKLTKKYYGEKK